MSRYYGRVRIEFIDGTSLRVGGNRAVTSDHILTIKTEDSYGFSRDISHYPLVNIKSWRWEDE